MKRGKRNDVISIAFLSSLVVITAFIFVHAYSVDVISLNEILGFAVGIALIMLVVVVVVGQARKDELRYFGLK